MIERFADVTYTDNVVPLAIANDVGIGCAAETYQFVLVPRNVELCIPREILGGNRMCVYCQLETGVLDLTVVTPRSVKT